LAKVDIQPKKVYTGRFSVYTPLAQMFWSLSDTEILSVIQIELETLQLAVVVPKPFEEEL